MRVTSCPVLTRMVASSSFDSLAAIAGDNGGRTIAFRETRLWESISVEPLVLEYLRCLMSNRRHGSSGWRNRAALLGAIDGAARSFVSRPRTDYRPQPTDSMHGRIRRNHEGVVYWSVAMVSGWQLPRKRDLQSKPRTWRTARHLCVLDSLLPFLEVSPFGPWPSTCVPSITWVRLRVWIFVLTRVV